MNFNIDVDTVVRYMTMTQKKTPPNTIDQLIESGDVPAILSKYVELTLDTNKLKNYLAANPDIVQALATLVPAKVAPLQPWQSLPQSLPPLMGTENVTITPGVAEPLGTIHKDVPATFDYPMDEYTQSASQSQDAVRGMLQAYQQIDPNGEVS